MKISILSALILGGVILTSCKTDKELEREKYEEIVAVANRGGESVTLIEAGSNKVINTITIAGSEPMYVVYVESKDRLYVGDRAGKKVHIVNLDTKRVESSIGVGNGVFHMWADGAGKQLWVNNDIDNSISVIDLELNKVVETIDTGKKPHDVFLTKDATRAFVSILESDAKEADKVYMYSTSTFNKIGEASVGKDPHLFHSSYGDKLFVACQSGELYTLKGSDLSLISNVPYQGAHGIYLSLDQKNLYVTNITGAEIFSINADNSSMNGSALSSTGAVPHNLVLNHNGDKMFVSHSGATSKRVSTYSIKGGTQLSAETSFETGTNPFGITSYVRKTN